MKLLNKTQSGRSMVEMLGVLAIIGVLSVGGIAGYSKAMFKHKMNKTIDEISTISQSLRTLCLDGGDKCSGSLYCHSDTDISIRKAGCSIFKNLKIVDDDMLDESTNNLMHAFNGNVDLSASSSAVHIIYYNLPTEACVSLATLDWESNALGVGELEIGCNAPGCHQAYSKEYAAKNNITLTRENSLPIPVDIASDMCTRNETGTRLSLNFY